MFNNKTNTQHFDSTASTPQTQGWFDPAFLDSYRQKVLGDLELAQRELSGGNAQAALDIVTPHAQNFDALREAGWMASDPRSIYLDMNSIIDKMIWFVGTEERRAYRCAAMPLALTFALQGYALEGVGRTVAAYAAFAKSSRWNPQDCSLMIKMASLAMDLGDLRKSSDILSQAYPRIWRADDLARWHHALGLLLIKQGELEKGALHLVVAPSYDASIRPQAQHALEALREQHHIDHTATSPLRAAQALMNAKEPLFAHRSILANLPRIIDTAADARDYDIAIYGTEQLYRLTGNSELAIRISTYQRGLCYAHFN